MSKIRILSEHLANQIAAGEVIERPASVVKELLENSLDARAGRITVEVEGGGARLIRVIDDGEGMDSDDVLLSLERHATSKLQEEAQLSGITTLGFRGEALPSIGSVSRLTIRSRPRNQDIGTRAEVRYGVLRAVHEEGCARGTVIEVRGLFGNLPARRKFLKSERTELYHIEEVVRLQALAHPATRFTLLINGRTVLDLAEVKSRESRIREILGHRGPFVLVDRQGQREQDLALTAFLLPPDSQRTSRNRLRILVNKRPVQDRMIRHGVTEGLQGFLLKGQQPAGVLFLTIPPEQVDINVHPAKHEVRFRNSRQVHAFLVQAVAGGVAAYQEQRRGELFATPTASPLSGPRHTVQRTEKTAEPVLGPPAWSRATVRQERPAPLQAELTPRPGAPGEILPKGDAPAREEQFSGLQLIGQLMQLYLLCERDGTLVIIDQHAAHERIIYQRFREAYASQHLSAQNLLFPVTVELTPSQAAILENRAEEVASLGLEVSHFGDLTWIIKAVPALANHLDPAEVLADILDALAAAPERRPREGSLPAHLDRLFSLMACKAAVKAGDRMDPREMLELLRQMEQSATFTHCPHGRPVIKTFSRHEIERWFRRA